ncbi:hypothetical protein BDV19DRAFT_365435 [Aspergillus venezuelensis]
MPLFSSKKNDPNLRRVQVVSRRLAFSNGYFPADIKLPKEADPSWHHHWAVRVEKTPNGGDLSDPNTWDYFGLAQINREAYFDGSAFHPERVRNWGHTKLSTGEILEKAQTLMARSTHYNLITSNCQDYVDTLAHKISDKFWAMSDETAAIWGVAGAYVGFAAALLL